MKSKYYTKYIRNYIGIVGLSILLVVPIYISIYREAEERISSTTYNELEENVNSMEVYLEKIGISADVFRKNEYVRFLSDVEGDAKAKDVYAIKKAQEALEELYMLRVEEIEEYLIFKDNDIVVKAGGALSSRMLQDYQYVGQIGTEYQDFVQWAFEGKEKIKYTTCVRGDKSSGIIGVVRPMETVGVFSDMAWVFKIDSELLNKYIGIEENSSDFAYITEESGELLYQMNCPEELLSQLSSDGANVLNGETGNNHKNKYNGKKYIMFQKQAPYSGWYWNIGITNEKNQEDISSVNRIIILYIVFAVIGICIVSAFAAWRNIRRESHFITEIENLKQSIHTSVLTKLFLCGAYSQKEKEDIENYLHYDMEFYCVICITAGVKTDQEILNSFAYVDEFMNEKFQCVGLSIGKSERNYIVRMDKHDMPNTESVSNQLEVLLDKVPEIRIGVSSIGTDVENIQVCYQQAKLMNRQTTEEYGIRINEYYSQTENNRKRYKLTLNLENKIYDLIYAGEKDALQVLFDKIRAAIKGTWRTETEIMQFFFEIQRPVARVCDEMQINNSEMTGMLCYQADKTIIELAGQVEEVSIYLCDYVNEKMVSRNKKESRYNMVQFIDENFADKNMSTSFASERMGLSEKYFAALFKEQTGKSFGTYLEAKRMNQAEKMLKETELSVAQIADEVGYNTLDAFYKSFKKNYGIAPGKWRSVCTAEEKKTNY